MKKYAANSGIFIVIIISMLTIPGCIYKEYTFDKAFNEMLELDKKYSASFYTEALDVENTFSDGKVYFFDYNRTIVDIEKIELYKLDLEKLKKRALMKETEESESIEIFIDTRIQMLEAEKLYQKGLAIGPRGDTEDGFKCADKEYIINLSKLFNESSNLGQDIIKKWDKLLNHNPETRSFLTGESRPKFYDSPFYPIKEYAVENQKRTRNLCP